VVVDVFVSSCWNVSLYLLKIMEETIGKTWVEDIESKRALKWRARRH
jgi:hypothetical protein